MNSKNITTLIPLHELSPVFTEWFNKCVKSIEQATDKPGKILFICPKNNDFEKFFSDWECPEGLEYSVIYNEGKTDFASQINLGVESTETEYFSVLEHDDEYSNIWFNQFTKYVKHYPDVDVFLPLVVDTNEEGQFIGFTNEAVWAMGFSEDLGYLDNNTLLKYQNFQVSGMIMKKDKYEEIGGLKPSFRLTFNYEFLLRATYNDAVIMTIPKVGYKHTNQRQHSLFWEYKFNEKEKLSQDEAAFWVELAKKEYFFTSDREVVYEN
jgi:hypothetical protein